MKNSLWSLIFFFQILSDKIFELLNECKSDILIEVLENVIPLWLKKLKPPVKDPFLNKIVKIIKKVSCL